MLGLVPVTVKGLPLVLLWPESLANAVAGDCPAGRGGGGGTGGGSGGGGGGSSSGSAGSPVSCCRSKTSNMLDQRVVRAVLVVSLRLPLPAIASRAYSVFICWPGSEQGMLSNFFGVRQLFQLSICLSLWTLTAKAVSSCTCNGLSMIGLGSGLDRAYTQSQRLSDHECLQACGLCKHPAITS